MTVPHMEFENSLSTELVSSVSDENPGSLVRRSSGVTLGQRAIGELVTGDKLSSSTSSMSNMSHLNRVINNLSVSYRLATSN